MRCYSIQACANRMDSNQQESWAKLKAFTSEFLKGGLVQDDSPSKENEKKPAADDKKDQKETAPPKE